MSTPAAALPEAFFVPHSDGYLGTAATAGPWDPRSMHFGPPAALLGRAVEALPTATPFRVVRATFEILAPVPVGPVHVHAEVVRPGRRIQLAGAVLSGADGTELALCRVWRIREAAVAVPDLGAPPAVPASAPEEGAVVPFFDVPRDGAHYGAAMEARFVTGGFTEPGPADVWMRMRIPLVAGEEPSPLSRVLAAVDSGNGVSAVADPRRLLFINPELTVHLYRHPVGEWVRMRARTVLDAGGSGLATSALSDRDGAIGTAAQSLFVDDRS